jgi:DNA-binding HxlR family transcriptional regulator
MADTTRNDVRDVCADRLGEALRCIDGRWKMPLLAHLSGNETMRFSDLQRAIPQASQKMLTQHLRELERDGIVARTVYPEVPPRVEYRLTDLGRVIEAAKTKPFGFMPFYPGPGLGGHCIPIDPFYLTWKAREFERCTRFIELAGEINPAMPIHVVERAGEALKSVRKPLNGSKVPVLGLAYKPNVDDERESPSYRIMDLLKQRGADVSYYDPYAPVIRPTREHSQWAGTESVPWDRATVAGFDAVIIVTAHACVSYPWIELVSRPQRANRSFAGKVYAFNAGLERLDA